MLNGGNRPSVLGFGARLVQSPTIPRSPLATSNAAEECLIREDEAKNVYQHIALVFRWLLGTNR